MRSTTKHHVTILIALMSLTWALSSCHRGNQSCTAVDNTLTEASLLRIGTNDAGYVPVDIVNPWDTTAMLCRLALVHRDSTVKTDLEDRTVVRIPVERSLVTSAIHAAAIDRLGALDAVCAMNDVEYVKPGRVTDAIARGDIADCGPSTSPSLERIIAAAPEVILATPYQNAGYGVLEQAGAVIIPCADYMETSPLGRAEWIRLIGLLYGREDGADSMFEQSRDRYNTLRDRAAEVSERPVVLKEMVTGGVWFVPGGASYQAQLIKDAGGDYPWADDRSAGSLQLDLAAVYDRAADADRWLLSTYGYSLTLDAMSNDNKVYANFKAYKEGQCYYTDSSKSLLYEETPFAPDLLLREYINIFHPGLLSGDDGVLRYYQRVK